MGERSCRFVSENVEANFRRKSEAEVSKKTNLGKNCGGKKLGQNVKQKFGKSCEEKSWETSDNTKRTDFGKKLKEM